MTASSYSFAEPASNLDGTWVKIMEARHYGDGVEFSPTDLDSMVRNYATRAEDAPVGVGPNWRGAKALGSIGNLRRNGNMLEAKLARVSPHLDNLYAETNSFPRTAIAIKNSAANGPSVQRVGFMRADGSWPNVKDSGTRVDALGNTEVTFSENSPASRIVSRLKDSGYWQPIFDEFRFPQVLASLQSSDRTIQFGEGQSKRDLPPIAALAGFIEFISDAMSPRQRGADADLHRETLRVRDANNISYSEALSKVVSDRETHSRLSHARGSNVRLAQEARKRATQENISYGEALSRVAEDQPQLTRE
jgi:hypothetical protein